MENKILIAICNYNHSKYLESAIESIQNQTYENLDICIYDDASNDQNIVKQICEKYKEKDKRIRVIYGQKNKGKWHGLNRCIETSDASICTAHDADDISLPDRIEMQFNTLYHTKSYHNLCGFFHCWNEEDIEVNKDVRYDRSKDVQVMLPQKVTEYVALGAQHPGINHYFTGTFETAGVTAMFYKNIWENGIRFNPPNLGLRTLLSEDSDFNYRVTSIYNNTSVTAEKLYLYRRNTSTNNESF